MPGIAFLRPDHQRANRPPGTRPSAGASQYLAVSLLAKTGQSIGKRLTKIKIVDAQTDEKVSLMRVFTIRSIIFIILNMMFMPFITILDYGFAFTAKRQALHDKLAKTKVVKQ